MQTKREQYKGHDIRVTRFFDGLKNALFLDGKFTGQAGFFSFEGALAYGEKLVDESQSQKKLFKEAIKKQVDNGPFDFL